MEIQETTKKERETEEKVVDLLVSTRKIKASSQEHGGFVTKMKSLQKREVLKGKLLY